MASFACNQLEETPITILYSEPFSIRYGFARSRETQMDHDKGQDYLSFETNGNSVSFVICDGVSLSFCGDLAAHFLSEKLLSWLNGLSEEELGNGDLKASLNSYLQGLTEEATSAIRRHKLPRSLPPLLRDVLEEKRAHGSESMFVCGRIDIVDQASGEARVVIASSGDIRVRLWNHQEEECRSHGAAGHTGQRWSTNKGLISGELNHFCTAGKALRRLVVYTDGFAVLDSYPNMPSTGELQSLLKESFEKPASDDISYLDITW